MINVIKSRIGANRLVRDDGFKNYIRDVWESIVKGSKGEILYDPKDLLEAFDGLALVGYCPYMVPCDGCFESTPTETEIPVLSVLNGVGMAMELHGVGFRANTLPADAGGITGDLEHIDDSESDTVSVLKSAYDFTGGTALVNNNVWTGRKVCDPGDAVNFEISTDSSLTTPSQGAGIMVLPRMTALMKG